MKRREFLKGVMGAGAAVAMPSLANADVPNKLPEGFKTEYKHVSYGLKDGVIQAYDPSEDSFIKKMGEGIQEGLDILDSIEYKELASNQSIPFKEWINLPETQALERGYKKNGILPQDSSWYDFEIVESKSSYEKYDQYGSLIVPPTGLVNIPTDDSIANETYALLGFGEEADKRLIRAMSTTFFSLRIAALNTKIEGHGIGEGKLIIQNRMSITLENDNDYSSEQGRRIMWRGSIKKIAAVKTPTREQLYFQEAINNVS